MKVSNIGICEFCDGFSGSYENNFSYDGKKALYDYFEQYEDEIGDEIEFDPIAICCEYSEYDTAWDAMEQYQPNDMPVEGEDGDDLLETQEKNEAEALRWLQDKTQVIEVKNGGIIILQF